MESCRAVVTIAHSQRSLRLRLWRFVAVAQADIIIVDEKLLPQAVELYNSIFRPKREVDFFKRRFMGRYNALTLLAKMDDKPVGFWVGFELKPGMFYHWLGGVLNPVRR